MTTCPLYDIGETVYLKESAALGFLEAVRIDTVTLSVDGWLYTVIAGTMSPRTTATFGDRRSMTDANTLYFTENEFVTICDALELAENNAKRIYDNLVAKRRALCPSTE